jgi:hypothetical protein
MSRPAYLLIALVTASVLGLGGLTSGCRMIEFYRQTIHPGLPADTKMDPELRVRVEAMHSAWVEALQQHTVRMVPLATANVLLSLLLIVASASALSGRARAHLLALQAVSANAAYAVAAFVLERPLRATMIDAMMRAPPVVGAPLDDAVGAAAGWWFYRAAFCLQLVAFGMIAIALTRPRVLALYREHADAEQDS